MINGSTQCRCLRCQRSPAFLSRPADKIRRYHLSQNLGDDGFGFRPATSVVNQNLCALLGECQGAGAAYAAGSDSNNSGFA
jgi:hypothetical protein